MAQSFSTTIAKPTSIFTSTPSSPLCTLVFVVILCILGLYTLQHHHRPEPQPVSNSTPKQSSSKNDFRDIFLTAATNNTLSSYLRALTLHPHLAGTPQAVQTALYVETHFRDLGLQTHVKHYNALLSYPTHASLSAHFSDGTIKDVALAEQGVAGDDDVVRPYHAYSPSGSAYGRAVFVNYGREEDYRALLAQGVSVSGCVAVARRGDLSRNSVVEKAAEKGLAAVLMYAETEGFSGGVERGTVMKGLGDPLTPGWASSSVDVDVDVDGERLGLDDNEVVSRFPKIPSMPISADSAETILRSLEGARVPYEWRANLKSKVARAGPGPTMLNFTYQGVKKMATIHNVFAIIRGSEEPDRFVLLGNHRDAWTYGSVDPNSGTAALLDIARRYALLLRLGWNPRRSIVLCSWDAEEFGMIGSTEWVEQNLVNLGSKAVAYLNVDCAVQGPGFFAGATPQLDNLLVEVTKKVKDPDSEDVSLYERWTTTNKRVNIQRLSGVDSDFAPFLQHAGVPSIDLYYGRDFPVYHTAFDSYNWMIKYGDPLFQRHVAVTGVWGLLALHLADDAVLPLNYISYAAQLLEYTNMLSNLLEGSASVHPITASIQELATAAKEAEEEAKKLRGEETLGNVLVLKKRTLNDRLMSAERGFLDGEGLQGRQWFKHLVYGPSCDHESKMLFFPGIFDAIYQSRRMTNKRQGQAAIQHEIWRVARAIQRAAYALRGELT
ncbi:probable glutamate carboxypeptidase AMP1 isoform X1 [Camellia sinensis]|uniref:probable glutamate carboxypeptidase AMP1 isoform X1 n=1 Tax=Camellia sinensis TaxID=4442 RepID=UPI0010361319|nr:probable glutamate carboxypeptidase AMP1 isoform X1 [Camellia sinensis]